MKGGGGGTGVITILMREKNKKGRTEETQELGGRDTNLYTVGPMGTAITNGDRARNYDMRKTLTRTYTGTHKVSRVGLR